MVSLFWSWLLFFFNNNNDNNKPGLFAFGVKAFYLLVFALILCEFYSLSSLRFFSSYFSSSLCSNLNSLNVWTNVCIKIVSNVTSSINNERYAYCVYLWWCYRCDKNWLGLGFGIRNTIDWLTVCLCFSKNSFVIM